MPNGVPRLAQWTLVMLVMATAMVGLPGARADNPSSYAIHGYVHIGTSIPVPAGVTVDLISGATHHVYTTTTGNGGNFTFTNPGTAGALVPGSWGLWVPAAGNVSLGVSCTPCAVLPASAQPIYHYETAQTLTSSTSVRAVNNVSLLKYNATLSGIASEGATKAVGANVELLAPTYNGVVLANNTTRSIGNYSMKVPWGTWVVRTTLPGVPTAQFDYQQVTVASANVTDNPQISNYLTYGTVYQTANPTQEVPYGGNVTVFDPTTHDIYSAATPGGGFYSIGTYPAGFVGGGANTFDVILSTIGYSTVHYPLTVQGTNPTGGPNPHNVWASAHYDPAQYNTTLTYSTGFKWLNTSTTATLSNDSTFPELPNASVGQLWAQLALDWQHNLTFAGSNGPALQQWVNSSGPFFPAGAAQAKVNNSGYNETPGGAFTFTSGCALSAYCGLASAAGLSYTWAKNYPVNGTVPGGLKTYTVSFNFRHPTNYESINYSIVLPSGYVLQAGNTVPSGARLVAGGPNGTWTKFTLVSLPFSSPSSLATFTFVKYGNITANVNATVSQFAFSKSNVLNATHGNYSVIVGVGQNVTFSAAGSTFPAGTNATSYQWTWGDSQSTSTAKPITYHTYAGPAQKYDGSLTVVSSGGTSASVTFHVYAGSGAPSGKIVSNATAGQQKLAGTTPYLLVNWSTTLHFNSTGFASSLYGGGPKGILSVASWNATAGTFNQTLNLTASSGNNVSQDFTVTFNGGTGTTADKQYLASTVINGTTVSFLGWRYNVSVGVWDGIGHYTKDTLVVLVRDTQKPVAVATVQDASGKNVTSAGVVEGTNHTVQVKLVGSYSSDPLGGGLVWYNWTIKNPSDSSVNLSLTQRNATGLRAPAARPLWLAPEAKPYNVNLTVTDRAGNHAYNVATLTVAVNTSTRPVLSVSNLTAPSTMTDGSSYTVWVNVTNTLGKNSTAQNVSVNFYLLPPSGSGSPISLGGAPSKTVFFGYNNQSQVNATPLGTGLISLKYNVTVRAEITFSPGRTGTWNLWVNATASNEFPSNYATGGNQAHVQVTLNPNPLTVDLEIVAVVVAVVAIVVVAYWFYRRSQGRTGRSGGGRGDRGAKKEKAEEPDEDETD